MIWTFNIEANKKKGTLTIRDRGLGMTAEEVEKYINQIAFSSAERRETILGAGTDTSSRVLTSNSAARPPSKRYRITGRMCALRDILLSKKSFLLEW